MLYGFKRTLFKAAGRLRLRVPLPTIRRPQPDIGIVGCGQFAFATLGYFLQTTYGRRIAACYDVDSEAARSFARAFQVAELTTSFDALLEIRSLRTLYIASNHASHAEYGARAMRRGLDVYVEKPIAVTHTQLVTLLDAVRNCSGRVFAGYNRPFSAAILTLRQQIVIDPKEAFSIQCFVAGHKIPADHWYRRPEEGTRVCGNLGHWLDLMVHVLAWRGIPDMLEISITASDKNEADDNLSISISTDLGDLFSVMMTSRCEPFEGINETINIQHAETTCKIDDFRHITIWQGSRVSRKRFRPKDVGHRLAVLQPFQNQVVRDWQEVVLSTSLMLHVADMVKSRRYISTFSLRQVRPRVRAA